MKRSAKPPFESAGMLTHKQISKELKRLMQALQQHQLELDVLGEYDDRIIYQFVTEELFFHEMEEMDMAGYTHHFCYEEFHPNHRMDIRNRSVEFITQWFSRKINEYSWELDEQFVHPDTRMFTREVIIRKINNLFEAYRSFSNCSYVIKDIEFNWDDERECGDGCVEGTVSYDALTEANETVFFSGPFKFYLSNSTAWWTIFYFVFPGFSWNE